MRIQRRQYPDQFDTRCAHEGCEYVAPTIILGERHEREEHGEGIEFVEPFELCKQDPRVFTVVL